MHSYRNDLRETLKLAFPVSIGQLGHILLGLVDSLMVGKVGAVPLAASSLVNGLVFLVVVFGLGLSLAITPLVAIAQGRNDDRQTGRIFRNGMVMNTLAAFFLFALTFFLSDLIVLLNQSGGVAESAVSYGKIISFSIIPFMIFLSSKQFVEGLSLTKPAMYATIAANVVNVGGNWVLIYGNLGFPALGLDGAGYSTLLTRISLAAIMMGYLVFSPRFARFRLFRFKEKLNINILRKLLKIGIPTGFQHFFEVGAFSFSAIMIGWLGSKALAAHQIALSMASVSFMIILGVAAAGTIRVSNALGRGEQDHLRKSGLVALVVATLIMGFFGMIFILFRHQLPALFISDREVLLIAANLLVVAAIFQISDGIQAVGLGILRGIEDVKIPMVISFIAYWVIGLPVGYLLGFTWDFGVTGIWIGLLTGLTVAAFFLSVRFLGKTRNAIEPAAIPDAALRNL